MKRNAIIRIILWSIVIILLAGILAVGLGGLVVFRNFNISSSTAETAIAVPITEPGAAHKPRPAEASPATPAPAETPVEPVAEGSATFDGTPVTSISIQWVAGNITIEPGDSDQIIVQEEGNFDAKYGMEIKMSRKGKLSISFCEENQIKGFGISLGKNLTKDLTIQVPASWVGEELEIDAAAANLEVYHQSFREVEINGVSGTCLFENCTVGELNLDTASGDVEFSGSLHSLDFDAASASFRGILSNVPSQIDMDSMSGDLDLTLPGDAGFSVEIDGRSSDFSSEFPTTMRNGRHVAGDGRCRIDVDAMSGDVNIRKAAVEPASSAASTLPSKTTLPEVTQPQETAAP